jgi:alpha-L-fucosidase
MAVTSKSIFRGASPLSAALLVVLGLSCSAGKTPAVQKSAVLSDWENLKFGMFIHYGMSTFTGAEFGEVPTDSSTYAPTALDVDQWIRVARDGGMKYAVLTSKHCYGHALWDSRVSDYDIATSSHKADVIRLFVDACRKYDIKPGFYYLLGWDKHNQKIMNPKQYEEFCLAQIEELLTGYGPITELWLDIPWDMGPDTDKALARVYAKVKALQPDCLVLLNQSFVDGSAVTEWVPTFLHKEFGRPPVLLWPKDLINGEVTPPPPTGHNPFIAVNGKTYYLPMETCDTLAHHWFWEPGDSLKSVRTLVRTYDSTVGRGANLLLDLAPDRTGRIPEATIQRLMEMKAAIADPGLVRPSLTFGARATASNVLGKTEDEEFVPGLAIDNDSKTRWATEEGIRESWLEVDLGSPRDFNGAYISEDADRIAEYALEVKTPDGKWTPFYKGAAIGVSGAGVDFPKTRGQFVRLRILKASGGPSIWDFELFAK